MIMRRGIKVSLFIMLLLPMLLWSAGYVFAASNLVNNGDFEEQSDGIPTGWTTAVWVADQGATSFTIEQGVGYTGEHAVVIENKEENHARFLQELKVEGDKLYRFSAYISTTGIEQGGQGAHLSVEGVAAYYPQVYDSEGQWTYLSFYGKTDKDQKELTVALNVGGYGSLNKGKARFDSVVVEHVSSVPQGIEIFPLVGATEESSTGDTSVHKVSIFSMLIIAALFSCLFMFVNRAFMRDSEWLVRRPTNLTALLVVGFLAAIVIRVWLALTHEGYANDMALFLFWSDQVVSQGIGGFYHADFFVDYPPGYIYVLYALGHLKEWFGWGSEAAITQLLYKLPAILADLLAVILLYRLAAKKLGQGIALGLAFLYLFNPAAILDSASWGQVDGIFVLILIISIHAMSEKRFAKASIWFAISALVKPQAFIFMPVLLIVLLFRKSWRDWATSAFYGFATFILLALPFFWGEGGLTALFQLYKGTLSSYPYATLNAFNVYALFGANWTPITEKLLFLSYQQWGYLFILIAVALAWLFGFRNKNSEGVDRSFFIAMVLIATVFIFVTKMHERYMFPIMLLSLFAFIQSMDRRMLKLFLGFTITNFINMGYVLAFSEVTTDVQRDGVVYLCAIANLALFGYMLYVGYDHYIRGRVLAIQSIQSADRALEDHAVLADYKVNDGLEARPSVNRLSRQEWWWMGGITLIYTIVALFNLGSMKEPDTVWQPSSRGDSFYVDLGEEKSIGRIVSYGGVGTGKFKYEFAVSPDQWTNATEIEGSHTAVFSWKKQDFTTQARYVKLTVVQSGFSIQELGIYEAGSKALLPITNIVYNNEEQPKRGQVANLFDEQSMMQYNHSFYHGTYFDEIYHARTAEENLAGIVAYENTHPPLGKIIIAIGIKLFGLNPFGWRIAGTVIGIAMIPLLFLMARRLFGKPHYAALAAGLIAVDFMHFTQTRISTIDVYGVFFIMLMFYFMHKYVCMSFYREKLIATLVPLGLAGLFFGIGVASKWIVLYGGAGLAIMLFLSLLWRFKEYRAARRQLERQKQTNDHAPFDPMALAQIVKVFPTYTTITLAACLLFYIIIPGAVYALSYLPILSVLNGGYTWKALVDYQIHMYEYHKNLVSSHPFSSSWWEWPFMKRPVWYYSGSELAAGMKSTIVAMGNPIIWWTGIFTMLSTLVVSIIRKDKSIYMIWIAYFSQYVPWMLVPRETFLYHYFAMVPFMILSIVYLWKLLEERDIRFAKLRKLYLIAAILLFILYYPALSGFEVPSWYVNVLLRWFPSWLF